MNTACEQHQHGEYHVWDHGRLSGEPCQCGRVRYERREKTVWARVEHADLAGEGGA